MDNRLDAPVLFLIFNRLDTAEKVFTRIRQAQPSRLYIAADGPRAGRPDDLVKCAQVRALADKVDWPCEVKTLFRDSNLGCKLAVAGGITWFFENEPEGIILEDDCLPHPDFFPFCQELLARYRSDESIHAISGSNIIGTKEPNADYFFAMVGGIWGWASWRRAWNRYEIDIRPKFTPENWKVILGHLGHRKLSKTLEEILRKSVVEKDVNTWDYQWLFARLLAGGKTAIPNSNLVSNLGFSAADSTHTSQAGHPLAELPMQPLPFPYRPPTDAFCRRTFDAAYLPYFKPSLSRRIVSRFRRLLGA